MAVPRSGTPSRADQTGDSMSFMTQALSGCDMKRPLTLFPTGDGRSIERGGKEAEPSDSGKGAVKRNPRQVKFEHAAAYEQIKLSSLMEAIASGLVLVDFDAWIRPSGSSERPRHEVQGEAE